MNNGLQFSIKEYSERGWRIEYEDNYFHLPIFSENCIYLDFYENYMIKLLYSYKKTIMIVRM